jgi:hypothetical protein
MEPLSSITKTVSKVRRKAYLPSSSEERRGSTTAGSGLALVSEKAGGAGEYAGGASSGEVKGFVCGRRVAGAAWKGLAGEGVLSLEFFLFILEARELKKLLRRDMRSKLRPGTVEGTMKIGDDIVKMIYRWARLKRGTPRGNVTAYCLRATVEPELSVTCL